jgi:hypothetical protein
VKRKIVALSTMITSLIGMAACTAAPGTGAGKPAGRVLAVAKHEVHEQCPLLMAHPSAQVITTQAQWSQLLANARMLPAPYEAKDTDFARLSIVLVALPTSSTPPTVSLASPDAVRIDDADQRLEITLRVTRPTDSADTSRAAVMASPCVVAWVPALPGLRAVVARTSDGQVIAQSER